MSSSCDILLKRPGPTTLDNVRRIASAYAWEVYSDVGCLTLTKYHVILDILYSGDNEFTKVNVSFASGDQMDGIGEVLLDSLRHRTLDIFNKNLRVLVMWDLLARPAASFSVFHLFKKLQMAFIAQNESLGKIPGDLEWDEGLLGLGSISINSHNRIGIISKFWQDDRYVRRWIKKNKFLDYNPQEYIVHFKVKENLYGERVAEQPSSTTTKEDPSNDSQTDWFTSNNWDISVDESIQLFTHLQLEFSPAICLPLQILRSCGCQYDLEDYDYPLNIKKFSLVDILQQSTTFTKNTQTLQFDLNFGSKLVKITNISSIKLKYLHKLLNSIRTWIKFQTMIKSLLDDDGWELQSSPASGQMDMELDEILNWVDPVDSNSDKNIVYVDSNDSSIFLTGAIEMSITNGICSNAKAEKIERLPI